MKAAVAICLRLLAHLIFCAFNLAPASAGNNIAARMAMMAMTTSNSIKVNPLLRRAFSNIFNFISFDPFKIISPPDDPERTSGGYSTDRDAFSVKKSLHQDIKSPCVVRIDDVRGQ